jgi:hypothetical protein
MSAVDLTHEMAEIKEQFAWSANIRADARQQEREAEEETAHFHLWLNNLEITLQSIQHDAEWRLKRMHLHSECKAGPTVDTQHQEWHDKERMPPPQPARKNRKG